MSLKKLFGKNIEPKCEYCRYCVNRKGGASVCRYGLPSEDKVCRKYEYDPLKREPRVLPSLQRFTADDFKL